MLKTRSKMIKWNNVTKDRYEKKGYIFTKMGDELEVKVEDLPNGSGALVDIECDGCGKVLTVHWTDYKSHKRENGKNYCQKCCHFSNKSNSISITHPHLVKYFVNKEDTLNRSKGSSKRTLMKCPDCGFEKDMMILHLVSHGLACPRCSDGKYPEKFMFCVLEQLGVNFKPQLNKTTFEWCNGYRYDFYIEKFNCIIETHGLQHYKKTTGHWNNVSFSDVQNNDKNKEQLAKDNDIDNYIPIDCMYSELDWIKNNIMASELPILLCFKNEDIDWIKAHEAGCSSIVKQACDLWNNGLNVSKIAEKLKAGNHTVWVYLTQGTQSGWCIPPYSGEQELKKLYLSMSTKVICLTTGEIFSSAAEAGKKYNMKSGQGISACCSDKRIEKSAGRHPETGEKLRWAYC
jgi:hypothetical protein